MTVIEFSKKSKVVELPGNVLVSSRKQIRRNTLITTQDICKFLTKNFEINKLMITTSSAVIDPFKINEWLNHLPSHPYVFAKELTVNSAKILSGFLFIFTSRGINWINSLKGIDGSINNDVYISQLIAKENKDHKVIDYSILDRLIDYCLFCESNFYVYKVEYKIDRLYEIEILKSISNNMCRRHR